MITCRSLRAGTQVYVPEFPFRRLYIYAVAVMGEDVHILAERNLLIPDILCEQQWLLLRTAAQFWPSWGTEQSEPSPQDGSTVIGRAIKRRSG
jgi:hypothetical protein